MHAKPQVNIFSLAKGCPKDSEDAGVRAVSARVLVLLVRHGGSSDERGTGPEHSRQGGSSDEAIASIRTSSTEDAPRAVQMRHGGSSDERGTGPVHSRQGGKTASMTGDATGTGPASASVLRIVASGLWRRSIAWTPARAAIAIGLLIAGFVREGALCCRSLAASFGSTLRAAEMMISTTK